jgi:hypothetical protein
MTDSDIGSQSIVSPVVREIVGSGLSFTFPCASSPPEGAGSGLREGRYGRYFSFACEGFLPTRMVQKLSRISKCRRFRAHDGLRYWLSADLARAGSAPSTLPRVSINLARKPYDFRCNRVFGHYGMLNYYYRKAA